MLLKDFWLTELISLVSCRDYRLCTNVPRLRMGFSSSPVNTFSHVLHDVCSCRIARSSLRCLKAGDRYEQDAERHIVDSLLEAMLFPKLCSTDIGMQQERCSKVC